MQTKREQFNGLRNRIAFVGIELEGGWNARPGSVEIVRDGSVEFPPPRQIHVPDAARPGQGLLVTDPLYAGPHYGVGEVVSRKLRVQDAAEWMTKHYPHVVNTTCGLHVHMSFHYKLNYSRLVVPEYTKAMVEALGEWATAEKLPPQHPLWPRLRGESRHCSLEFLGDNQIHIRRKDYNSRGTPYSRYTFINYCHAQHQTVECRGLCMFGEANQLVTPADVQVAIRAVHCVIDTTNRFLSKCRQRERATQVAVSAKSEVFQEFGTMLRG